MDNFFTRMFSHRREVTSTAAATPSVENSSDSSGASYEARIERPSSPESSLTISAVYRAVELRAKTIGQMLMQYQRRNPAGGNYIPSTWGEGKRINYLLQLQPNPLMTASTLLGQIPVHRLLLGNAFVYVERDDYGEPKAFWLATCGGYNPLTGKYTLTYLSDKGWRTRFQARREDVLHFANTFRDRSGFWGIPTIQYAIDSLSLTKTESMQALDSAAKGGRVKLIIGEQQRGSQGLLAGGLYSKPDLQKYAQEINDEIYSQDVVSLRGLDKVQSISMSAQEMQMIDLLGMGMDDVARFFATPRPLLMLDANSHYTTPTNATMEYLSRTIAPEAREIEDEFNRKLLLPGDFDRRRYHLCEQPLLRMDKETQAKVDQLQLQTGAATVNEIRQQYDRPSVEGGDTIYLSTNLAELGSEKLRGASGQQQPAAAQPDKEDEKGGEA